MTEYELKSDSQAERPVFNANWMLCLIKSALTCLDQYTMSG